MSVVERAMDKLRRSGPASPPLRDPASMPSLGALVAEEPVASSGHRIAINREAVRAAGYLPEADQDRQFADEYRKIKRPLIAAAFAPEALAAVPPHSPRLIMMASALPGDGKTFTSINLALSLSRERDSSVVLVDADVAKPHISRIFGVDQQPGLLDALADELLEIESLVVPTDVRGLAILPAGKARESATELLASARMTEIVTRLIQRNPRRIVLFDTSPLLVSSESRALAGVVGQVVLVVRAGKTPRHAVAEAIAIVGADKSIGLVLNQGRRSLTEGIYGYGTYGEYGEPSDASP